MLIVYFVISFAASVVGAISGIGGGVIIKPVLDTLGGLNVATISFLSSTTVLSMTAVTLLRNISSPVTLNKRVGLLAAVGGVLGGFLGKYLFDMIRIACGDDNLVGAIQASILALITAGVLIFTIFKSSIRPHHIKNSIVIILVGLMLGGMASFLGIGGGPINLAVLYLFFAMDSKTAALCSIFIIFFSQMTNLIFSIAAGTIPPFAPFLLVLMIIGGIGGGLLGSFLSHRMTHRQVDRLFMVVMTIIIAISIRNFIGFIG